MSTDKRKINAWVPVILYDKVINSGYSKITEAVISGLELLVQDTRTQNMDISGYEQDIMILQAEIDKLQVQCTELQEHNSTLKQDLQDMKELHSNYMLQVQTLINQKAIEAPNAKRPWWKVW
jgi:predicted RNase H-like nuclease (RuvC/YqgF family)